MVCLGQEQQSDAVVSRTGPEAAQARKDAKMADKGGPYNIKLGGIEARFSAGISEEYNDNIGISSTGQQDDFITTPHLGVDITWPFSQLNTLSLKLGISYQKYINHPSQDSSTILIQPDSVLDFDFYAGDVHFNLHDQISLQQDPSQVTQLSNLATFRRLENTAGIGAEWDLNTIMLEGGYDNSVFHSLENRFTFLDRMTHSFHGKAGVKASANVTTGLLGSYSMTEYDQGVQNNSRAWSSGIFADVIISEFMRGNATVSYQNSEFDRGGTIADNTNFGSMVYSFTLQHQLNQTINHSIGYHRYTSLGIGSNFTDTQELNYQISLELMEHLTTGITFYYQWFEDSKSLSSENGTRFGIGPQIGYSLTESTHLTLSYQYSNRDSNLSTGDYQQNVVRIDLNHQF